jgi:phosphatidylglycerol:prolipoprotein diacylglycerol transferase
LDFWTYLDLIVPSIAIAQGFGRIGCFAVGCCYGKETDSVFCIVIIYSTFAGQKGHI